MKKILRICKCGHGLDPTHKKEKNLLGLKYKVRCPCNKCDCKWYLQRDVPTKFDTIMNYIAVGMLIFLIAISIFLIYVAIEAYHLLLQNDPTHILKKPFITYGGVFKLIPFVVILFIVWMVEMIIDVIKDHRYQKNRDVKPIED